MLTVPAIIISTALFLAMVLNLALKPSFSARLSTAFMMIAVVGGLLYYGMGYVESTGDLAQTIIRTPLAVARMFIGVNDLSAIAGSTLVSTPAGLIVFWLLHLLAFYSMASAALITLGAEALRQLRFLLSRRGDLTLIYGVNEHSIELAKECLAEGGNAVVFVCDNLSPAEIGDLNNQGMTVMTGQEAVNSTDRFVRKLRIRRRKLSVYALDEVEDQNLYYALRLKDALKRAGVAPENTRLTLPGAEDIIASMLQVSEEAYGFGYVYVYDVGALAARALIKTCPPWDFVRFGADGRAQENFECVLVGFGHYGQAALKQLVMNGQFAGSRFLAAVFSPSFVHESGYITADCPELLRQYDIRSYAADGRSSDFYDYIAERINTIKMIAVCTGSESMNREISNNLMLYLKRRQAEHICVVQCGRNGVRYQETVGSPIILTDIYTLDLLSAEKADRQAIVLNSIYDDSDRTPWEKWVACDTFSKMSSRASTDFIPAFIKAAGSSLEEVMEGKWQPDGELLKVLGETEHLRWNAFHYAMGYTAMSREEFEDNARTYARCKAEGVPCNIKIAKNQQARTHACLVPWEELDALSERENAITGRGVDYQRTDINNVLGLPQVLGVPRKEGTDE